MSIDGKVALITGAGQGIGRGIALRLAADGAEIAIVDLNESKMGEVADEVRRIGRKATTFVADVTDRDQVYAAVDHAESALGGFEIMVNNAGIAQVNPIVGVQPDEVSKILAVNVEGVLWESKPRRKNSRSAGTAARSSTLPRSPATTDSPCSHSIRQRSLLCAP
jgi:meso-butanediol dehydrogenase/(S,S)-butanediol dehydrogenase/diacetyl reductase